MQELTTKIKEWAVDRNLHAADPFKQFAKLTEEIGELAEGLSKSNSHKVKDSIGDIYVALTTLSLQLGLDIEKCILMAYDEIKNRKGKMINGVYVKESDL